MTEKLYKGLYLSPHAIEAIREEWAFCISCGRLKVDPETDRIIHPAEQKMHDEFLANERAITETKAKMQR